MPRFPHHPFLRPAALTAALLAFTAAPAAAAVGSGPAATAGSRPAAGPATAVTTAGATATSLTLLNGDRALVADAGPHTAAIQPAPGSALASAVVTLRLAGRSLLIPVAALPYLGRGLDTSLFDVSGLRRAEQGGRLPVNLRYRGSVPALPGVTVTHASDGTAQGYLTAASAATFGAALARQVTADHAAGSYGTRGLFAGGLSISLPGAPAAPARHRFPMHTLTATGTNLAGQPDTGDVVDLFNIDDLAAFGGDFSSGENVFFHGSAKFSAPAGNYWGLASFFQIQPSFFSLRLAVVPQFKISGDTSVHFAAKTASSKLVMKTARPVVNQGTSFTIVRGTPKSAVSFGFSIFGAGALLASPTHRKPSDGTLNTYAGGQFTSPGGVHPGYAYTLDFAGPDGLVPPLHYTARPADLTTVSERYFQDVPATGGWLALGGTAHQIETSFIGGAILPLHVPATQTQYISARPAMLWQTLYIARNNFQPGQTGGGQTSAFRLMHGGQHLSEDWNAYPLHPAPNVSLPGTGIFANEPSAVRAGDELSLTITPFSDNQLGHLGTGFSVEFPGKHMEVTGSYELDQNGKKIAGGNAVGKGFSQPLVVQAKLSPNPATIRFVVNASRLDKRYPLSATSQDVWTWHTKRQPSATVRGPWECGFSQGHFVRKCAVQPMLTLRYQVARLQLSGTASPGQQAVDFTASHLQQATASRITKAGAQVSFDNGKTWRAAKVKRVTGGTFRAVFTAPAHGAVSLRVSAQDASGATVTETVLAAYQTSA